jgi:hypothetical protein
LAQIAFRHRLRNAKSIRFVGRTAIGAEKEIHERGDVGVVAGVTLARMVPMMQFGSAEESAQGTEGETDVGMNVNSPETPEG